MAIASLILGILSLVFSFIPFMGFIALAMAVVGLILGIMGKKELEKEGQATTPATAGIVMSTISIVWYIISWIIWISILSSTSSALINLQQL